LTPSSCTDHRNLPSKTERKGGTRTRCDEQLTQKYKIHHRRGRSFAHTIISQPPNLIPFSTHYEKHSIHIIFSLSQKYNASKYDFLHQAKHNPSPQDQVPRRCCPASPTKRVDGSSFPQRCTYSDGRLEEEGRQILLDARAFIKNSCILGG
jgi:hypothetical protein